MRLVPPTSGHPTRKTRGRFSLALRATTKCATHLKVFAHMDFSRFIAAHSQWKLRLRKAIDTGGADVTVEMIKVDDKCEFGRYFYSLPSEVRAGDLAKLVREKHAAFHVEAARVLAMALAGKKLEANRALDLGSEFAKLSADLTRLLMEWQRKSAA